MWISLLISQFSTLDEGIRNDFRSKSKVIEEQINRNLHQNKIKIRGIKKATITLENEPIEASITGPMKGFSPVVNLRRSYDFDRYYKLTEELKNKEILSVIESGLSQIAEYLKVDLPWLREVSEDIKRHNFTNSYIEGTLKYSRDKKYKAGVEISMQPNFYSVSVLFFFIGEQLLKKIELFKAHPNRMFIDSLVAKTKWISNKEFEVTNKEGEIHFIASIEKEKAMIEFTPKSKNTDKLIDDLLTSIVTNSNDLSLDIIKRKIEENLSKHK